MSKIVKITDYAIELRRVIGVMRLKKGRSVVQVTYVCNGPMSPAQIGDLRTAGLEIVAFTFPGIVLGIIYDEDMTKLGRLDWIIKIEQYDA